MRQNPLDYRRVFDASNDLDPTRTALAGLDIDIKHTFQPLHPGHRLVALGGRLVQPTLLVLLTPLASPAPFGRSYPHPKLAVRREHPMKARQICAGLGNQGNSADG